MVRRSIMFGIRQTLKTDNCIENAMQVECLMRCSHHFSSPIKTASQLRTDYETIYRWNEVELRSSMNARKEPILPLDAIRVVWQTPY